MPPLATGSDIPLLSSHSALTLWPVTAHCVDSPQDVSLALTRTLFIWLRSFVIIMKHYSHILVSHTEHLAVDVVVVVIAWPQRT